MTKCDLSDVILLSGADGLRPIVINETKFPGVVVHRSDPRVTVTDSITLFAANADLEPVKLSVDWGDGGALITTVIPPGVDCFPLVDSAALNGDGVKSNEVRAFASRAGAVSVFGDGARFGVPVRLH